MGRKPIGAKAMSNAERQKRYRDRVRQERRPLTTSEQFRRKLYYLIRWFGIFLSATEIKETLESFGYAWVFKEIRVNREEGRDWNVNPRRLTPEECLEADHEDDRMLDVLGGESLLGNPDWVLGDEDRYRRGREERARKYAEFEAEWDRKMAAAVAQGHDPKTARLMVCGAVIAELGRQVA
jgi:hypothetical protein